MKMRWLVTQKMRMDIAASFMVFVNFGLIVIGASDKIAIFFDRLGVHTGNYMVYYLFVVGITSAWTFGYLMDRWRFLQTANDTVNARNPQLVEIIERLKEIEKKMEITFYVK